MKDCIFCKIISDKSPSLTIFEDEIVRVFMDKTLDNNGHILIVPKKHIVDFTELDDKTAVHINQIVKKLKTILDEKLNLEGYRFINNSGGTHIKHYHLHMVPYYIPKQKIESPKTIYEKIMH